MSQDLGSFAKAASAAARSLGPFEAQQTLQVGPIRASARVRVVPPERISVEYTEYASPLADMDDVVGGATEFGPSDLAGATLSSDGQTTWIFLPKMGTCFSMSGRLLFEPIPGIDALGELRFLDDLARDYLLRDGGDATEAGRRTRVLAIRPKHTHVSSLFRFTAFSFVRGEIAFDAESLLPHHVKFLPSPRTPVAALLGPEEWVMVGFRDLHAIDPASLTTPPVLPPDVRTFTELVLPADDAAGRAPFPLGLAALRNAGYEPLAPGVRLMLAAGGERGYATWACAKRDADERSQAVLVVRCGNYLSRLMARRRALAADRGETVQLGEVPARLFDRTSAWPKELPPAEMPMPIDLAWDSGGIFWLLSADGVSRDDLVAVASTLG